MCLLLWNAIQISLFCLEKSIPDHPTLIISRNDGNSKLTPAENFAKASYGLHIFFYGTYLLCSQMVRKVITRTVKLVISLLEEVIFSKYERTPMV